MWQTAARVDVIDASWFSSLELCKNAEWKNSSLHQVHESLITGQFWEVASVISAQQPCIKILKIPDPRALKHQQNGHDLTHNQAT